MEKEQKTPKQKRRWGKWFLAFIALVIVNVGIFSFFAIDNHSRTSPQFCASCHNMESHVESYLTGDSMDNVHFQANVGCKDCHYDYTVVEEVASLVQYVSGDYDKVIKRRKVENDMCLQCHISLDYQADRTDFLNKNPHLSHWPDLRCTSCHISHDKQEDYCSRCHENGGQRMTGDEVIPRGHNPWAETDAVLPINQ